MHYLIYKVVSEVKELESQHGEKQIYTLMKRIRQFPDFDCI